MPPADSATEAQIDSRWDSLADEIDRLNRSNPRTARERAAHWVRVERRSGSKEGWARAVRAHAHALRFLGLYEQAVAEYQEAVAAFSGLGLQAEAARTSIGQVTALRYLGRYEEAISLAKQNQAYFLDHGDWLQAAKQGNNLGTLYRPMGRLTAALKVYREARAVFRRLGEQSALADVEQNLGNVLVDLGRYGQALQRLRAAERIRRNLGLQTEVALTLLNIGSLSHRRGDYGQALQALNQAKEIYESLGVQRGARLVDIQLLPICMALNLREESAAAANRAVTGLRSLSMPLELGKALLAAGAIAETAGDWSVAREQIDEASRLFQRVGNPLWKAMASVEAARLSAACTQDQSELDAALQECQTAADSLEQAGALDRAAYGRLVEGALLVRLADHSQALERFHQVIESAKVLRADHLLYRAYAAIGRQLESSDPERAIASYRLAVDHLETVRSRTRADELKLSFLADKTDLYERVVGMLINRGSKESTLEAYSYVERSKSPTLLEELLAGGAAAFTGRSKALERLARQVRDIRTRLNTLYTLAYAADETPSSTSMARSAHAEHVAQLEKDYAGATRELQLAARTQQGEISASMTSSADPNPSLSPGTALVEFYSLGSDLVAFVWVDGELRLRRLASLDEVLDLSARLSFQLGNGAFGSEFLRARIDSFRQGIDSCLQALWQRLVEPLEMDLTDRGHIVVVPHGPLHGLPFHAFHDGNGYLVERYTVTYAPSAGVYRSCLDAARPLGHRAVVVGIDDPNLPWVAREVETVARVWPTATVLSGQKASRRALRRQLGKFDALHIAAHAVFRADNPMFSSIKLADAWVTVAELGELSRGAQLVTLSACETGLAGLAGGDEVLGLTRGILGAGCSMVVASLWPVADETTALLMEQFYGGLLCGAGPAEALRSAILKVRTEHDHPYFWAPFVMIGAGVSGVSTTVGRTKGLK
jgi:tetratricopeptide (TPR) repeat protein